MMSRNGRCILGEGLNEDCEGYPEFPACGAFCDKHFPLRNEEEMVDKVLKVCENRLWYFFTVFDEGCKIEYVGEKVVEGYTGKRNTWEIRFKIEEELSGRMIKLFTLSQLSDSGLFILTDWDYTNWYNILYLIGFFIRSEYSILKDRFMVDLRYEKRRGYR